MKILKIISSLIISLSLIGASVYMYNTGSHEWGWFLFGGLIVAGTVTND